MSAPVVKQFEAKLYALRKTKEGTIVQLLIHPHDDVSDLLNTHIGTDLDFAWTLGDPKPVEVEPIEVKLPKAAQARKEKTAGASSDASAGIGYGAQTGGPRTDALPAPKPKRKFADMSLPEQCGVRCGDGRFERFFRERYPNWVPGETPIDVGVRAFLLIESRKQLSTDHDAANRWRKLEAHFQQWLTDETYKEVAR